MKYHDALSQLAWLVLVQCRHEGSYPMDAPPADGTVSVLVSLQGGETLPPRDD